MKWDGIAHHTDLGNGTIAVILCRLARTAREYALPISKRRLVLLFNHEPHYCSTRSLMKAVVESGS